MLGILITNELEMCKNHRTYPLEMYFITTKKLGTSYCRADLAMLKGEVEEHLSLK